MSETPKNLRGYLEKWAGQDTNRKRVRDIFTGVGMAASELGARLRNKCCELESASSSEAAEEIFRGLLCAHAHVIVGDVSKAAKPPDDAEFAVILQPLTNHANLEYNGPLGTIFSVVSVSDSGLDRDPSHQLAAGIISYGARTMMAFTVGDGTHILNQDASTGDFMLCGGPRTIAPTTIRYGINTSYQGNWNHAIRDFVQECLSQAEGPLAKEVHVHWTNCLVTEALQVILLGGICLYPSDSPKSCLAGCVMRLEEAHPVAWLVEQAGGLATNGPTRVFEMDPDPDRERIPFVFGSSTEVRRAAKYCQSPPTLGSESPLFGVRGFFRH